MFLYHCKTCARKYSQAASMYHSSQCILCFDIERNRPYQGGIAMVYEEQGADESWFTELTQACGLRHVFILVALAILVTGTLIYALSRLAVAIMA